MVPLRIRAIWPGTNATIPAGWTRDTSFDNDFALQGHNATFTGPVDTINGPHTHDIDQHSHAGSAHAHRFTGGATADGDAVGVTTAALPTVWLPGTTVTHKHPRHPSNSANLSYTLGGDVTLAANLVARPPSTRIIVIKPDDTSQGVPNDAVGFADDAALPAGFTAYAALHHRFLIGAPTGDDAGAQLGTDTHDHTLNPTHDHAVAAHAHATKTVSAGTKQEIIGTFPNPQYIEGAHHTLALDSGASGTSGATAPDTDAVDSLPSYATLKVVRNTSGVATTPTGIVLPYVADIVTTPVPAGWTLMDGTGESNVNCYDRQIRCTITNAELGVLGGSNTHAHTVDGHTHTSPGMHNHTGSQSPTGVQFTAQSGLGAVTRTSNHSHAWTIANTNPADSDSATPGTSTDDVRRNYRTVVFLKKLEEISNMPTAPLWRRRRKRRNGSLKLQKITL